MLSKTNHRNNDKDDYGNNYDDKQVSTVNDGGCSGLPHNSAYLVI
jgi:hypothetical protein